MRNRTPALKATMFAGAMAATLIPEYYGSLHHFSCGLTSGDAKSGGSRQTNLTSLCGAVLRYARFAFIELSLNIIRPPGTALWTTVAAFSLRSSAGEPQSRTVRSQWPSTGAEGLAGPAPATEGPGQSQGQGQGQGEGEGGPPTCPWLIDIHMTGQPSAPAESGKMLDMCN